MALNGRMYWEFAVKPRAAPLAGPIRATSLEMWAVSRHIALNLLQFNCGNQRQY
jgi:hypothetical protein